MALLKRTMFREYDIRGRETDDELNEDSVYHIARGFAAILTRNDIKEAVVGNDARATSESFSAQIIRGLIESGVNVIDIGTVTTPMSYWAQYHFNVPGLAMITASHNPAGWNGLKLGTGLSKTLLHDEIKELYALIEKEVYVNGAGTVRKESIADAYIADLVSRARISRPIKVLVNTANGTAGLFAPKFLRAAGCEVIEHYTEGDATYPHYTANPDGTAMMEDTGTQTKVNGCDIGMAFLGGGDRLRPPPAKRASFF